MYGSVTTMIIKRDTNVDEFCKIEQHTTLLTTQSTLQNEKNDHNRTEPPNSWL